MLEQILLLAHTTLIHFQEYRTENTGRLYRFTRHASSRRVSKGSLGRNGYGGRMGVLSMHSKEPIH